MITSYDRSMERVNNILKSIPSPFATKYDLQTKGIQNGDFFNLWLIPALAKVAENKRYLHATRPLCGRN